MTLFDEMKKEPDIILLDYQATLVENFNECVAWRAKFQETRPYTEWIVQERYRTWLRDLIKNYYVILITARSQKYHDVTLAKIKAELNWLPQEAYFNRYNQSPPVTKKGIMEGIVFPEHGTPENRAYLALESNKQTRAMYAKLGIEAIRIDGPIAQIPKVSLHEEKHGRS